MRRVTQRRSGIWNKPQKTDFYKALYTNAATSNTTNSVSYDSNTSHSLTHTAQNQLLRDYEVRVKNSFDEVQQILNAEFNNKNFTTLCSISDKLGIKNIANNENFADIKSVFARKLYAKTIFNRFLQMSNEFFKNDPLDGKNKAKVEKIFKDAGFHAVGLAPCADGRLAHMSSYVLRLPYSFVRRKAHAGSLFDISESVRNWVFIEHSRFRDSIPNLNVENTKYLKIAVYHFSSSAPNSQGCAAHGSDDSKAAEAALNKLKDFKQAIENRFKCGTTVQTLLLGIDTDNDSLKVHVPNSGGDVCLKRFVETQELYNNTLGLSEVDAKGAIATAIDNSNIKNGSTKPAAGVKKVVDYLITSNISQIEYVKQFEGGAYKDIGHAERFISVGSEVEEVQLRNLSYYSFLDTIEEGANDIDVGIKIFKGLNIKNNLPIPIIIRRDYDGRVPGSRERALNKALSINNALLSRYKGFAKHGWIDTLVTLRDWTQYNNIEVIDNTHN
jgi:carboxysome shell carbonic anhydrase